MADENDFSRQNLFLSQDEFRVRKFGVSGGAISTDKVGFPLRKKLYHVRNAHADIVFLDIGSNDLCDPGVSPAGLAADILKIARYVLVGCEAKIVVISALLRRIRTPKKVPDYNTRVTETNSLLKEMVVSEERVMFCYHSRFDNPGADLYDDDGIHVSYGEGYKRYIRSVRGAVLRARKHGRHLGMLA